MEPTRITAHPLNAAQTTYANKVEAIIAKINPSEAPFSSAFITYCFNSNLSPEQAVAKGLELAL